MLDTHSLSATINAVNETYLFGEDISSPTAKQISDFIAGRQGLRHSYFGLFAPLDAEVKKPFKLFSGEQIRSDASSRHILGEESLRLLKLLGQTTLVVQDAIDRAQEKFGRRLLQNQERGDWIGMYCCGTCSVAYWRALTTNWISDAEMRLSLGMQSLKDARHDGKWRRFPFYYTVLALTELPGDIARGEMAYILPSCERALKFLRKDDSHQKQKRAILTRLLKAV